MELAGALLLTGIVLWVLAVGFNAANRWRLRSVPLVRPVPFLLGHMWHFAQRPMFRWYEEWMRKYGGLFLIFFGKNPVVVLSDPDLIRQVGVKHFSSFHDRPIFISAMTSSKDKRIIAVRSGLLAARGPTWGSLRAAMQPLFHTSALKSYSPIMNEAVGHLLERLDSGKGSSSSSEGGGTKDGGDPSSGKGSNGSSGGGTGGSEEVDVHALLGRMTMEVIGRTAFGIEFDTEGREDDWRSGKPNLVAALKLIFSTSSFMAGTGVAMLFRIVPNWMEQLLFKIFFTRVGGMAKRLEYARTTFMSTADLLMQAAKRQAVERGEQVEMLDTDWKWWSQAFTSLNPYQGVTPAPGSVIDLLMRATNKATGTGLTDVQIAAQLNTLIAAGYETSANALAFAIYCLATHPKAEAHLLAEIDVFGRDKEPGLDDLESFPYTAATVNEVLRMYPPAHVTTRECTAPGGAHILGPGGRPLHIPESCWVHINIWGLHHNKQYWPRPWEFRPERFLDEQEMAARHPNAFLPFGLGPRMCIGWRFALQEVQIALIRLYQRYTFQLAPGHQQQPLQLRAGITLSPKNGLWVTPHKRSGA